MLKHKRLLLSTILLAAGTTQVMSQTARAFTAVVKDEKGAAISSAIVQVGGQRYETDSLGAFVVSLANGKQNFKIDRIGYQSVQQDIYINDNTTILNFVLPTNNSDLTDVVVIGSRSNPRTSLTSPVPVDVHNIQRLASISGQGTVGAILNYVAPSFTSTSQSLGDGTDEVDPISLRGLGPDQVLVLVNGKRRYNSALVNVNGTFGRGSVGTDLNAIPVSSIEKIEVLRDGAAAQYGSDAVAGVINIILKKNTGHLNFTTTGGEYVTHAKALNASFRDGQSNQVTANFGIPLTKNGGYINFSGSFDYRKPTNRGGTYTGVIYKDYYKTSSGAIAYTDATDSFLTATGTTRKDYSLIVGQSKIRSGQFAFNGLLPISDKAQVYGFGTFGYRNGLAPGFYRYPTDARNIISINPLGYMPYIGTSIYDKSFAFGIKGDAGNGWKVDFSNTFGQNTFEFHVENSLNVSMGTKSPTTFNNGGPKFTQNTVNLDLNKDYDWLSGVNLAFGAEYRLERYQLIAGDENSYANYTLADSLGIDANGNKILSPDINGTYYTSYAADGSAIAGGSQVFLGFRPKNAVNTTRNTVAGYADVSAHITEKFLADGAVRYENYSDFGSTTNGKLALLYKVDNHIALRGSVSTGFRAPSLQQLYYQNTSTVFINSVATDVGTFSNSSRAAKLLGIPTLRPEKSKSASAGVTAKYGKFSGTFDAYFTRVNDRIVYTNTFSGSNSSTATAADQELYAILQSAGASSAQFFTNAINTETRGMDVVLSYTDKFGAGRFRADVSGTMSETKKVGAIKTSALLANKQSSYFGPANLIYLTNAVPKQKMNVSLTYDIAKWTFFVRNNYFGGVTEPSSTIANQQFYDPRWVTDATIAYQVTKAAKFSVGSNNIFDIYPEKIKIAANSNSGQFVYPRATSQFGFYGRYLFARLEISL